MTAAGDVEAVAGRMAELLGDRPRSFYELVRQLDDVEYPVILRAWGALREGGRLGRDAHGHYLIRAT